MSIVADILFVVAGLLTVLICVKRGFFLTLLRFLKLFLAFGAAYLWGGAFGSFLGEKFLNTPIRNWVFGRVNEIYQNTAGGFDVQSAVGAVPDFLLTDSLRGQLEALGGSGEELVNSVTDTVAGSLSSVICSVLGFILVFLLAFLALTVVYVLIKHIKDRIPIIGLADRILGGVLGLALAWMLLLVVGSLLKVFFGNSEFYTGSAVMRFFGDSDWFRMLNVSEWINGLQQK